MKVLDLDGDRDAVVGRVQIDGKEYDVRALPMGKADALLNCGSIANMLTILAEAVPTMPAEVLRGLNILQLKAIVTMTSQGNAGGSAPPFNGARGVH